MYFALITHFRLDQSPFKWSGLWPMRYMVWIWGKTRAMLRNMLIPVRKYYWWGCCKCLNLYGVFSCSVLWVLHGVTNRALRSPHCIQQGILKPLWSLAKHEECMAPTWSSDACYAVVGQWDRLFRAPREFCNLTKLAGLKTPRGIIYYTNIVG